MLIGFVLLVSACGNDACEALPISEHLFPSREVCERMAARIKERRPNAVLLCGEVYRSHGSDSEETTHIH
ncbi:MULTISPECIES: hypothetical protein [Erwinia]|uniref:hypothetical protein n=1 Tax=Erwinia TaxID=551 RepID=UPI000557DADE|nr:MULTISPECIES: hypothetical protein [Erwinia]